MGSRYNFTAYLIFYGPGFNQTSQSVVSFYISFSKPVKQGVSCAQKLPFVKIPFGPLN